MNTTQPGQAENLFWWHRFRLGSLTVKDRKTQHRNGARANGDTLPSKIRRIKTAIFDRRALAAATVGLLISTVVDLGAQYLYYSSLGLIFQIVGVNLDMAPWIALLACGSIWVWGVFAAYCAERQLPAAKHLRRMWFFAGVTAAINASHGYSLTSDIPTGVVLGAASLIGPFVWHSYVTLRQSQQSGITLEEVRERVAARILHPLISFRAARVRSLFPGMSRAESWDIATQRARRRVESRIVSHSPGPQGPDGGTPLTAQAEVVRPSRAEQPPELGSPRETPRNEVTVPSFESIADLLGYDPDKHKPLDLRSPAEEDIKTKLIRRYYEIRDTGRDPNAVPQKEIAESIGCDRSYVRRIFREVHMGLHARPTGRKPLRVA